MEAERTSVKAVYDDDLVALLRALDVYGDFTAHRLRCAFCRDTITWDNLYALYPDSGAVKCCCSKPDCVEGLLAKRSEKAH
ncbi:MAG: hypothetical protein IVW55_12020 [Chloroflexi bacterium]|nr:hypothetical protein [Chloroflexota bacterium]